MGNNHATHLPPSVTFPDDAHPYVLFHGPARGRIVFDLMAPAAVDYFRRAEAGEAMLAVLRKAVADAVNRPFHEVSAWLDDAYRAIAAAEGKPSPQVMGSNGVTAK